ncbi:MAG: Mu transposase/integrase [Glaciihabitans sp.]|nr:Mu transposase/integrase [Glaciihabitans sp.]
MAHLSDRQKAELVRQQQDGVPWTRLAEHSGVAVRTLQRWAARMATGQLARAPRRDKGSTRTAAELVTAIEALVVRRPAPTTAYIHRRIGDTARDRGLPAPGYTTVREIVHSLDAWRLSLTAGTRRTGTGSSWSTAARPPRQMSSGRWITPCSM